ncbi:MAG TPA: MFS transporter, partial [Polyangiaceae bacterium]|nr:MFS transporter [Polyangiaceae bacterium]
MNNNNPAAHPGVSRYVVLATCCLSLLLVTMDVTIVNVALPAIRKDLGATVAGLQWSIDGYTVVVACFLMLAGSMGDRHGRKRTFQVGLALFSAGSLLCSLAPTTSALVAARVVQALGGAMLNPVAMSIIVNTFTDPRERARAIGVWGAVFGVSMAVGPVVGGLLTEHVGWRSIFWINVPIGLMAIALTARFVPESRAQRVRRVDPVGQMLIVIALASLTSGVIDGRRLGWS